MLVYYTLTACGVCSAFNKDLYERGLKHAIRTNTPVKVVAMTTTDAIADYRDARRKDPSVKLPCWFNTLTNKAETWETTDKNSKRSTRKNTTPKSTLN